MAKLEREIRNIAGSCWNRCSLLELHFSENFRIAPVQPAGDDGWIPHFGQCKVPENAEVRRRDGKMGTANEVAYQWGWEYGNTGNIDVLAYRPRKPVEKWQWWVLYQVFGERNIYAERSPLCTNQQEAVSSVVRPALNHLFAAAYRIEESRVVE